MLPGLANAQDASPDSGTMQREVLVEMTIAPDLMPDPIAKLGVDRHTIQPGVVAEFDRDDEGIRGRSIYLESGTMIVEPLVPSLVWRAVGLIGAPPEVAQAGAAVQLNAGDSMYLPALSREAFRENDRIRITNPGSEPAVQLGVHLHESGGGFSHPQGYSYSGGVEYYSKSGLEQIQAGDTLFRLTRITAEPGVPLPIPEGAVVTFYQIDAGEITQTFPQTNSSLRFRAGQAFPAQPDQKLRVSSDGPAQIMEIAVIPSVSAENVGTPTSATPDSTIGTPMTITVTNAVRHPIGTVG